MVVCVHIYMYVHVIPKMRFQQNTVEPLFYGHLGDPNLVSLIQRLNFQNIAVHVQRGLL